MNVACLRSDDHVSAKRKSDHYLSYDIGECSESLTLRTLLARSAVAEYVNYVTVLLTILLQKSGGMILFLIANCPIVSSW